MRKSAILLTGISLYLVTFLFINAKSSVHDHAPKVLPGPANSHSNGKKQKMQVVFALDATGSMSGLISAAKDKIWSIVNSLSQTEDPIEIEVGLVFYRDRGDAFITKRIQLTDSIDMVYAALMQMNADGGGDGPESVNQGLNEAVELFNWDKDSSTYKTVFLVGDCEPHMDYRHDVPYYVTCGIAKSRDIVLNTILMGENPVARKVWNEIAACNQGSFVNVNMGVNDIAISTPFDSAIAVLNDQVESMQYFYGAAATKEKQVGYNNSTRGVAGVSNLNVQAQRAEYKSNYKKMAPISKKNEIMYDMATGNIKLDDIPAADLPDEFRNMSKDSIRTFVRLKSAHRDSLQTLLDQQVLNRNKYIQEVLAKKNKSEVEGSFNNIIFSNIKKQTAKKNIVLKGSAKY